MTSGTDGSPAGDKVALRCMEIWGGNRAVDQGVSVPGVDVYVYSSPHDGGDAGGDIYSISQCGAGNIVRFVLADVAGHGSSVTELAGTLQRMMRRYINTPDQTRFARELNRAFDSVAREGRFATALLATYWAPTSHLILVNAGHPPPLRYSAGNGRWSYIERSELGEDAALNLPLGVIEPTSYSQEAVALEPGDVVVMYTDALVEAGAERGEALGQEGLLALVSELGETQPCRVGTALRELAREARGGRDAGDDETVIVLGHNGAKPPEQTLTRRLSTLGRMIGLGRVYRGEPGYAPG